MKELQREVAQLESINDHMLTELEHVHELLKSAGFEEGIADLKLAGEEMATFEQS